MPTIVRVDTLGRWLRKSTVEISQEGDVFNWKLYDMVRASIDMYGLGISERTNLWKEMCAARGEGVINRQVFFAVNPRKSSDKCPPSV